MSSCNEDDEHEKTRKQIQIASKNNNHQFIWHLGHSNPSIRQDAYLYWDEYQSSFLADTMALVKSSQQSATPVLDERESILVRNEADEMLVEENRKLKILAYRLACAAVLLLITWTLFLIALVT